VGKFLRSVIAIGWIIVCCLWCSGGISVDIIHTVVWWGRTVFGVLLSMRRRNSGKWEISIVYSTRCLIGFGRVVGYPLSFGNSCLIRHHSILVRIVIVVVRRGSVVIGNVGNVGCRVHC